MFFHTWVIVRRLSSNWLIKESSRKNKTAAKNNASLKERKEIKNKATLCSVTLLFQSIYFHAFSSFWSGKKKAMLAISYPTLVDFYSTQDAI